MAHSENPFLNSSELVDGTVTLRPYRLDDADDLVATCADPAVLKWTQVPQHYTRDMALDWCANPPEPSWVITSPTAEHPGRYSGQIDMRVHTAHYVSLGYMSAPWARGQGLMTAAVRIVTDFAFARGAQRVEICVHPDNAASRKVAEKAGFTFEGIRRNGEVLRGDVRDLAVYSAVPGND